MVDNDERSIAWGAEEIGTVIEEKNIRRVYYLLESGFIPGARKVGRAWMLSIPVFRREFHGENSP
ncbi:MAG: hypothetical protein IIC52_01390 [Proteobacteria bacterium]|nr:hypothetical protein [Pseudomonadota bacterium]